MSAPTDLIIEIKRRLGSVRDVLEDHGVAVRGKTFRCISPDHEDKDPSAGLYDHDQRFKCHSCGIGGDSIAAWATLNGYDNAAAVPVLIDRFGLNGHPPAGGTRPNRAKAEPRAPQPAPPPQPWKRHGKIVESYAHTAIEGTQLEKDRYEPDGRPKFFTWRHLGDEKQWLEGQGGHKPMPYNVEAIADACDVYLVEGEKDADTGNRSGITCVSVEKDAEWPQEWLAVFKGVNVHIIPDNDETGRKHAQTCARNLYGTATEVRIVTLPGIDALGEGADLTDWLAIGHHVDELADLVCDTPPWRPEPMESESNPVVTREPKLATTTEPFDPGEALIWGQRIGINQVYFATQYAVDSAVIFDPGIKRFYIYDENTGLWLHQSDGRTLTELGQSFQQVVNREVDRVRTAEGIEDAEKAVLVARVQALISRRTASMLKQLRDLVCGIAERRDAFGHARSEIHVANGMLAIDGEGNVELRPFGPEYYSRNRSGIAWDPVAPCPRFLDELLLPAVRADDARLIQRYAGQILLGYNLSQTMLLLRGTPGGGKSTLANVIEGILGRHNCTELRTKHLSERFELVRLIGRTLLSGKDVPGDFLSTKPAHVLKALVGGDVLEGESKGGNESFPIKGVFNVLITTNTRLRVKLDSDTSAWRRRLLIVDYDLPPVAKPIPMFADELVKTEGPGILRWAVEGAVQLLSELAEHGRLVLTDEQSRRVDDLLSESDSVRSFVRDCIERARGEDMTISELGTAYRDYCDAREWEPLRDREFQAQVPDAMLEYHRATKSHDLRRDGKSQRGFRGLKLKSS